MSEIQPIPATRARMLRLAMVVAAVALFAVGVGVVLRSGSSGSSPAATAAPASQVNAYATAQAVGAGPVLYKLNTGDPVPFNNGETLKIDDLDVTVFVTPYPPPRAANIDFGVERSGAVLDDANVTMQYDMTTMAHGPFRLLAIPAGRGHYVVPVEFEMEGDFYLNVAVDTGAREYILQLGVRAKR